MIGLSVISGEFSRRFLKYSFHFKNFSSWQTALFCLRCVLSFAVGHTIRYYLSSSEFLIYGFDLEYILITLFSICWFLDFRKCVLAFVEFFFYLVRIHLSYLVFFLTTSNYWGTLHLVLDFVDMQYAAAYIWAVTKASYSSFGICL